MVPVWRCVCGLRERLRHVHGAAGLSRQTPEATVHVQPAHAALTMRRARALARLYSERWTRRWRASSSATLTAEATSKNDSGDSTATVLDAAANACVRIRRRGSCTWYVLWR